MSKSEIHLTDKTAWNYEDKLKAAKKLKLKEIAPGIYELPNNKSAEFWNLANSGIHLIDN